MWVTFVEPTAACRPDTLHTASSLAPFSQRPRWCVQRASTESSVWPGSLSRCVSFPTTCLQTVPNLCQNRLGPGPRGTDLVCTLPFLLQPPASCQPSWCCSHPYRGCPPPGSLSLASPPGHSCGPFGLHAAPLPPGLTPSTTRSEHLVHSVALACWSLSFFVRPFD